MIELRANDVRCTIEPEAGGRIAGLAVNGRPLLRGPRGDQQLTDWGSYPMAPFAGRVRNGRFEFDGNEYQLELNHPPHAMHGAAFSQAWSTTDLGDTFVVMTCGLVGHWPFGGTVTQRIELFDDHVDLSLWLAADQLAMPAQLGWHPWFLKPDSARLEFEGMFLRGADGIPTGEIVAAPNGPWDDCFVGARSPLELEFTDLVVQVTSDCDYWVVYDKQADTTCLEPQSGPPNGFNMGGPNMFTRLEPGEVLRRSMTISWQSAPAYRPVTTSR